MVIMENLIKVEVVYRTSDEHLDALGVTPVLGPPFFLAVKTFSLFCSHQNS